MAIERLRVLWDHEKRNATPMATVLHHWGYKPTTGPGRTAYAALKKFGLIIDEGRGPNRTARVSNLGHEILLNPEPEDAIREAALHPKIHRELWEEYGIELPSPVNLRYKLIKDRSFTERGADELIEEYTATVAFAKLGESPDQPPATPTGQSPRPDFDPQEQVPPAAGSQRASATAGQPTPSAPPAATPTAADILTIPIPLVGARAVQISGSFPISPQAWDQLIQVLEAMKPGLVANHGEEGLAAVDRIFR